jgi:REP element-mobilizing transposase RayT
VSLVECNGEDDHVHLLAGYPPKAPLTALVNSLKGVSARRLRQRYQIRTHRQHLRPPSYLAATAAAHPGSHQPARRTTAHPGRLTPSLNAGACAARIPVMP